MKRFLSQARSIVRRLVFARQNPRITFIELNRLIKTRFTELLAPNIRTVNFLLPKGHKLFLETKSELIGNLQNYTQMSMDFDECKSRVQKLVSTSELREMNVSQLLYFQYLLDSYGFFESALSLDNVISQTTKFDADSRSRTRFTALHRKFLIEISEADLPSANETLARLMRLKSSFEPHGESVVKELQHYLFVASNGGFGKKAQGHDSEFRQLIQGKDVVIVGPGEGSRIDFHNFSADTIVVRMLKPNLYDWSDEYRQGNMVPEIAYISGDANVWLEKQSKYEFLYKYVQLCFRPKSELVDRLPKSRQIITNNFILLRGAPHMLLYIIWDLSIFEPKSLCISNIDFYSSQVSFRENSRRTVETASGREIRVDKDGSHGYPFERCRTHAAHGVVGNRRAVKTLCLNHKIEVTAEVREALDYDDLEYCKRLEDNFGRYRK